MSFSKSCAEFSLTEWYIKTPKSLEQQTLENVALRMCHNWKLKQHIFIQLETPGSHSAELRQKWEESILKEFTEVCKALFLTRNIQERLIVLIRKIALQLLLWSGIWKDLFDIPYNLTADIWILTDWKDGRLDERKIAERIIRDKRISCYQLYRLSCIYCLEESMPGLWDQLSRTERISLIHDDDAFGRFKVIKFWSKYMKNPKLPRNDNFFLNLLHEALLDSLTNSVAVVFAWNKLKSETKEKLLKINYNIENHIVDNVGDIDNHENERDDNNINDNEDHNNNDHFNDMLFRYFIAIIRFHSRVKALKYEYPLMNNFIMWLPHPSRYLVTTCFLLLKLRESNIIGFEKLAKTCESIIKNFLNWPSTDL